MEKTWNGEECFQEWLVDQNYSKSAMTTHEGVHRRNQNSNEDIYWLICIG